MLLNLFINVELLLLLGLFQWTKVGKFLWKINHKFILVFPLQIKITRLLLKFMIFDLYLSHMCLGYWLLMILTKLFISFFLQYIEFLNVNNNTNMIINNKTTEYSFKILCPLNYILIDDLGDSRGRKDWLTPPQTLTLLGWKYKSGWYFYFQKILKDIFKEQIIQQNGYWNFYSSWFK